MTNLAERNKKIMAIAFDCSKSLESRVDILNRGGFKAPCGNPGRWEARHIQEILIEGKPPGPRETKSNWMSLGLTIDPKHYEIISNQPGYNVAFCRDAIAEKIEREGLA